VSLAGGFWPVAGGHPHALSLEGQGGEGGEWLVLFSNQPIHMGFQLFQGGNNKCADHKQGEGNLFYYTQGNLRNS